MEEKRLPRNKKEGFVYGSIICAITVIIMLILNISMSFGKLDWNVLGIILKLTPIVWIIAMLVETIIVGPIANKLVNIFTKPTDSFNSKILFNILFCVTGMSICMTIIGGMIGNKALSLEPFITFFSHWPRNFCVAIWCEILLAQPIARLAMKVIHNRQFEKNNILDTYNSDNTLENI